MFDISFAGAFLAGLLSLLSPCSSLLLPAFFAFAFQSPGQLAGRAIMFFLGLCTLLVPLGLGSALAAQWLIGRRELMISLAGGLLIAFGLLELSGRSFALLPQRLAGVALGGGRRWLSVYGTGVVYGFGGFCAGPLLGSVLTVAAGSGRPVIGALLLATYAFGMVTPLVVLAALWERYQLGRRRWLRGRELHLGPWRVHSFNLVAGLLFIGLGISFIATGGMVGLEGAYDRLGLSALADRLEDAVFALTEQVPDWLLVALLLAAAALFWRWRRRSRPGGTSS